MYTYIHIYYLCAYIYIYIYIYVYSNSQQDALFDHRRRNFRPPQPASPATRLAYPIPSTPTNQIRPNPPLLLVGTSQMALRDGRGQRPSPPGRLGAQNLPHTEGNELLERNRRNSAVIYLPPPPITPCCCTFRLRLPLIAGSMPGLYRIDDIR